MAFSQANSLCWYCKWACGGCSWSDDGIPVEGWDAEPAVIKGTHTTSATNTWEVQHCPGFIRDVSLNGRERTEEFRRRELDTDGCLALMAAVIKEACKDYKTGLKTDNEYILDDVRRFFRSQWFRTLSDLDPDMLMASIKELLKEEDL